MFHVKLGEVSPNPDEGEGSIEAIHNATVVGEFETREAAQVLVDEICAFLDLSEWGEDWWTEGKQGRQLAVWVESTVG